MAIETLNIPQLPGRPHEAAIELQSWPALLAELQRAINIEPSPASAWLGEASLRDGRRGLNVRAERSPEASWTFEGSDLRGAMTIRSILDQRSAHGSRIHYEGGNADFDSAAGFRQMPYASDVHAMLMMQMDRALRLCRALESTRREHSMLRQSAQTAETAMLSLSAGGEVLYATASARTMLVAGDGLVLRGRHLRASVCAEQQQLSGLLQMAGTVGAEQGAMLISRQAPRRPLQLIVTPEHRAQAGISVEAAVLVFLSDPDAVPSSRAPLLRKLYGLSPTECRLADQLAAGIELQAAAERLRLTVQTARFHLKSIFRKTDTNRQTDLVRLILGLPGAMH